MWQARTSIEIFSTALGHALPWPASPPTFSTSTCERFHSPTSRSTSWSISGPAITSPVLQSLQEISRVLRCGGLFVHETPVRQLLAHPVRSFGRHLPWSAAPRLRRDRLAFLWSARR